MVTSTPDTDSPTGHRPHSLDEIRETYAEQADRMDRLQWMNRLLTGRYRRRLFGRAEGRVLDAACGTGLNLRYLPRSTTYVGIDASPEVLTKARHRVGAWDRVEALHEMDAQALDFQDESFDTVVSSLSTCTFPDPVAALDELARVCKPGGRVLLLEHGRSSVGPVARFQDWRADAHYEKHSCRWNQEPLALLDGTDLVVRDSSTAMLGIITATEAEPTR
jgi:ubiquinone/menaquinone biosynthesis C-methylase UbiE